MAKRASIKKQSGIWEQLLKLKAVTLEMGTIHEAQVLQLKVWSELAFPTAEAIEVAVGLPYLDGDKVVDQHLVEFRLVATDGRRPPKDIRKRMEVLARSVSDMLGDVFTTKVLVNGTLIFKVQGKRRRRSVKALVKRLKDADEKVNGAGTDP